MTREGQKSGEAGESAEIAVSKVECFRSAPVGERYGCGKLFHAGTNI
jgi:hypothetical protein